MIKLKKKHFIAKGAFCSCYQHPKKPKKCVKVLTDNSKASKRLKADIRYYNKLYKKGKSMKYIAKYLGVKKSNKGKCYLYKCVKDYDGEVSQTLESYLNEPHTDKAEVYRSLKELADYLIENQIMISDLHARNILIKKRRDGSIKPVIVDGIGDRVAIPVLNMLPSLLKAKIVRRWNRFSDKFLDSQVTVNLE